MGSALLSVMVWSVVVFPRNMGDVGLSFLKKRMKATLWVSYLPNKCSACSNRKVLCISCHFLCSLKSRNCASPPCLPSRKGKISHPFKLKFLTWAIPDQFLASVEFSYCSPKKSRKRGLLPLALFFQLVGFWLCSTRSGCSESCCEAAVGSAAVSRCPRVRSCSTYVYWI